MRPYFAMLFMAVIAGTQAFDQAKPWPQGRGITREVILGIPRSKPLVLPSDKYLNTVPKSLGMPENIKQEILKKGGIQ